MSYYFTNIYYNHHIAGSCILSLHSEFCCIFILWLMICLDLFFLLYLLCIFFFFFLISCHWLPASSVGDEKMDTNLILISLWATPYSTLDIFRICSLLLEFWNFTRMYLGIFFSITSKTLKSMISLLWVIFFFYF